MDRTYWHRQLPNKPLFPDLIWSRPENKLMAGKLLIVGGNLHGFAAPAQAYQEAYKAGIGMARVLLPDALKKIVGKVFEVGEFAPSTPSGSFSQSALNELLTAASWADGILFAGDLGRNSETAILLEKFVTKHKGQTTFVKDTSDYFSTYPMTVLTQYTRTLILGFSQLQHLAQATHFELAFTSSMDLLRLVDNLHFFTQKFGCNIVVKHAEQILVAVHGQVSTTEFTNNTHNDEVPLAVATSVWWLQNPSKTFEALTNAVFVQSQNHSKN